MNISDLIENQKSFLVEYLEPRIKILSQDIVHSGVENINALDELLVQFMQDNEFVNIAYVLNPALYQISSNVTRRHIKTKFRGQDLSFRPFLQQFSPQKNCYLTDSYLSMATLKPCISLVFGIKQQEECLAVLVLDLDLIKLPLLLSQFALQNMEQIKGDASIRSGLFNQVRNTSKLDTKINEVHAIVQTLIIELGIFHIKIHYAASRVTLWQYQDPYKYLVLSLDELLNSNIYLLFPAQEYPQDAVVDKKHISQLLDNFKYLRFMDENMYLRAGSINIMNGIVGVNFSCDGYHYIQATEFLENFNTLYA